MPQAIGFLECSVEDYEEFVYQNTILSLFDNIAEKDFCNPYLEMHKLIEQKVSCCRINGIAMHKIDFKSFVRVNLHLRPGFDIVGAQA